MKNFKDIILSIFAIIGFVSIITSFNTQSNNNTAVGQFQVSSTTYDGEMRSFIYETIINTSTGKIISRKKVAKKDYETLKL